MDGPLQSPTDDERIATAFAEQGGRLLAFVRRELGDASEAEEIVQEVFYELVVAYRLMRPIEHLVAWLMRVARNRIIDRWRAREPDIEEPERILDALEQPEGSAPETAYARAALADALEAALAQLPAEQREAFVAHELEGRSIREIALSQGVPVGTLLWRKRAAVLHLRDRLRAAYDELGK